MNPVIHLAETIPFLRRRTAIAKKTLFTSARRRIANYCAAILFFDRLISLDRKKKS